jgi:hypothetical protein
MNELVKEKTRRPGQVTNNTLLASPMARQAAGAIAPLQLIICVSWEYPAAIDEPPRDQAALGVVVVVFLTFYQKSHFPTRPNSKSMLNAARHLISKDADPFQKQVDRMPTDHRLII